MHGGFDQMTKILLLARIVGKNLFVILDWACDHFVRHRRLILGKGFVLAYIIKVFFLRTFWVKYGPQFKGVLPGTGPHILMNANSL